MIRAIKGLKDLTKILSASFTTSGSSISMVECGVQVYSSIVFILIASCSYYSPKKEKRVTEHDVIYCDLNNSYKKYKNTGDL